MARKLRIAASVFFGLLTVALGVLWVRSYWWEDTLTFSVRPHFDYDVGSSGGGMYLRRLNTYEWSDDSTWPPDFWKNDLSNEVHMWGPAEWDYEADSEGNVWLSVPHWFLALSFASIALAPWLAIRRFSLRNLFIATTVVAVVLGLGVWLAS